jgi:hypothetical protein
VGGGDIGFHDTFAKAHTSVVSAERGLAVGESTSRIAKSLSSAVFALFGVAFVDLATRDVVVRAKAKPGAEMFDGLPAGHIDADLRDDSLSGEGVNTINGSEIDASHQVEMRTEVKAGLIAGALGAMFRFWEGFLGKINLGFENRELSFDLSITRFDLVIVELEHLDHLLESKEMFILEVAVEGLGDVLFGVLAFAVAELSEDERIAFAIENGLDDAHAGEAGDIGDDRSEFDVHKLEGFLNVLDMGCAMANETITMADVGPECANISGRDERALE